MDAEKIELLVTFAIIFAIPLCEYLKVKLLFDHVKESISYSKQNWFFKEIPNWVRSNHLKNASDFESKHLLSEQDKETYDLIIGYFKEYMMSQYFGEKLKKNIRFLSISDKEYFILCLIGFLYKYENSFELHGREMRTYAGDGKLNNIDVEEYSLTDLGTVYRKIMYCAKFYCAENGICEKYGIGNDLRDIKNVLDSGTLKYFKY